MKNFYIYVMPLMIMLLLGACSKEEELEKKANNFLITLNEAVDIVKEQRKYFEPDELQIRTRSNGFTKLKHITLNDPSGLPALYIINYRDQDQDYFNIVSVDKRLSTILAFGEGQILSENIRDGLNIWLKEQIKVIEKIRLENLSLEEVTEKILQGRIRPSHQENPCEGQNWVINVGPLMATEWGQGCNYNDDLGLGCPITNCERELTGCIATAMAQIIRYHEYPDNYQWDLMLANYNAPSITPTQEQIDAVAELMLDAGIAVGMDWGCEESSANVCGDVPEGFTDFFSYTSTDECIIYSPATSTSIKNEINKGRPVIFRGEDDRGAHAWVCDAYSRRNICTWDENTQEVYSVTYLFFHMNWGWDEVTNGWFGYTTWGGNFSTDQRVIINIKP